MLNDVQLPESFPVGLVFILFSMQYDVFHSVPWSLRFQPNEGQTYTPIHFFLLCTLVSDRQHVEGHHFSLFLKAMTRSKHPVVWVFQVMPALSGPFATVCYAHYFMMDVDVAIFKCGL